jgi:hypothetical protein
MRLKAISLVIILGGILFSLYLQTQIADGVYFSGDGGLKALLAKQLASGKFTFDLASPQVDWIDRLWNADLYPYNEPYVYLVAGKHYITFPYTFPLVTAPFYALFGYRGLYLIPLVSCWFVWLIFYLDCLKLKLSDLVTSLGLICLIFGSYLTIYSAMYWEHTLAVALAFTGLSFWFILGKVRNKFSIFQSILSGILIGLSVWFRPEFICVVIIIIGLVILTTTYSLGKNSLFLTSQKLKPIIDPPQQQLSLILSMLLTVGGFFVSNQIIYGYAVGIHGIQVVEPIVLDDRIHNFWQNFTGISLDLVEYLPIILLPIFYLVFYLLQTLFFKQAKIINLNILDFITYLAMITFEIGVSLLVPVGTAGLIPGGKQWGVRFLLMLVPIVTLFTAVQIQRVLHHRVLKYITIFMTVFLLAIGINKNVVQATQILTNNNQDTAPAIEYLQRDTNQYIAISHEFVGQTLEATTVNREIFFTVDTLPKLIQFAQTLIEQQQNKFTYICYPHRPCKLPQLPANDLKFQKNKRQYQLKLQTVGKFGKYPIYQGEIQLIQNS